MSKGSSWAEAFLEMMSVERAAAKNTLTAYARDLADAQAFLAGRGRDLADASAEDVEAYFAALGARGLSPATAARRRAATRQFYRFVLAESWRTDDPSRRVEAPKKGRSLPKVLSREEMGRLIAAAGERDGAQGLRLACMIELAYASGLRISELTGLTLAALARDPAYLIVRGKGGKERLAPLNDATRAAVKAYLALAVGAGLWFATTKTIPREFLQFAPHLTTLVVLALAAQRLRPPAADGIPYRRGS